MGEYGPRLGAVGIELDTMDETILTAEGSHVALVLMSHTDGVPRDLANTGGKIVVNVPDPAATIALAVERGGAVMRAPEPNEMMGGKHIGFITDPDGQVIELIEA